MTSRQRRRCNDRESHREQVLEVKPAAGVARAYIPVMCLILCSLAPIAAFFSFQRYWFTDRAVSVCHDLGALAVGASVILAGLIVALPRARDVLLAHLERMAMQGRLSHTAWLGASYLGLFAFLYFLKYCQYRGFQFTMDTAVTANIVYNLAHSWKLESSVIGVPNYLAIHFMPGLALLTPAVLLWNDLRSLMIVQTLLLASVPLAAYFIAFHRSRSASCAWSAFWLVFTSPFYFSLASANIVFQIGLPAFFLWGAYFAETRRWKAAALCALVLVLTIEQTPVLLFGLGLYLILKMGVRTRSAWLAGAGVCLSATLLWLLERHVMHSYPSNGVTTGGSFSHLAPSLPALLGKVVREPVSVARAVLFPLSNLKPLCDLTLSGGGLFLLSPQEVIPWVINFLPNFLSTGAYHDLQVHYPAYIIGPFWWSVVLGLAGAHSWLERRGKTYLLLALALLIGARNLYFAPAVLLRDWARYLFSEAPPLASLIPSSASVWAGEHVSPLLSCRPFVWSLQAGDNFSTAGLFAPDYVLFSRELVEQAPHGTVSTLLNFLSHERYEKVSERSSLILLRHPRAPLAPNGGRPPRFEITRPDPKTIAAYASYLARNDAESETAGLFRSMAEQGDEKAQYNLGVMYREGRGVTRDLDQSILWFTKAAEHGEIEAENNLGSLYAARGDWAMAARWFRGAAEKGLVSAEFNLGVCLSEAPPPIRDAREAAVWLGKVVEPESIRKLQAAVSAGDLGSATILGTLSLGANGLPQDLAAAARWFRLAAEKGDVSAQYNLGVILSDPSSPVYDRPEAARWLGRAAAAGDGQARARLVQLQRN